MLQLSLAALVACSAGAESSDGQGSNTSGQGEGDKPTGYQACFDANFASYLDACVSASDCAGAMQCDQSRTFAQSPRCHARTCEDDSDCEAALADLCRGSDFHFECRASNSRVPKECRLVEGGR